MHMSVSINLRGCVYVRGRVHVDVDMGEAMFKDGEFLNDLGLIFYNESDRAISSDSSILHLHLSENGEP